MRRTWQLLAFLARYAHQPIGELEHMPMRELVVFADEVGELIRQEYGPHESAASGG